MGLKEDLEAAKAKRPQPVYVDIAVGETLYKVEVRRLDGMQWAGVLASAPPTDVASARLGYSAREGALQACREYGRLLDSDDVAIDMSVVRDDHGVVVTDPWADTFEAISGVEVQAIAASWWALNSGDPNKLVGELKKASAGGSKTS